MITETQIQLLHKYNATIKNLKLLIMCNDENLTTKLKVFLTEWCFVNLHFTDIYLKEEILSINPDVIIFYSDAGNDFIIHDIISNFPLVRPRYFMIMADFNNKESRAQIDKYELKELPEPAFRGFVPISPFNILKEKLREMLFIHRPEFTGYPAMVIPY